MAAMAMWHSVIKRRNGACNALMAKNKAKRNGASYEITKHLGEIVAAYHVMAK